MYHTVDPDASVFEWSHETGFRSRPATDEERRDNKRKRLEATRDRLKEELNYVEAELRNV